MIRSEQIDAWLKEAGVSEAEARKMLDGGLAQMLSQVHTGVIIQTEQFVEDLKRRHDGVWTNEKLQIVANHVWEETYNKFMSRRVFDLFVRVAESKLLPGFKEGHFRTPSKKDVLTGRSGDPIQDLCMALLSEAGERRK